MNNRDFILNALELISGLEPACYEQLMFQPFPCVPSYAMEDSSSDWWNGDDAIRLMDELKTILNVC